MLNLFYRNLRLLILSICLIVVWGLSSYNILPRMEDPLLTQRFALINTHFPGASASRVESLVTEKIESELLELGEIKSLESTSRIGLSSIRVELHDSISDVDEVWSRVRDRLDRVETELPPEATKPEYRELEARASAMIVALKWQADSPANYAILGRLAEDLETEFRALAGTEKIDFLGLPDEEIIVEINPTKLSSFGITPQELARQIRNSDAKVSAGQLRSSSNNLLLEVDGELDSLDRISNIPINYGSSGQFVLLGDIALVTKGIRDPAADLAIVDGRSAVVLSVLVEPEHKINLWAEAADKTLAEFRQKLPRGIELDLVLNQSIYVERRINGLLYNLLFGAICVLLSTLFMMGWKSALIVGSALPLSILMVFGGMHWLGIPLHQMSITGLVIALGLLIDNAVVVVDEVQHQLQQGLKVSEAVSKSVGYLSLPLLASTLTTVLTFLPIALMPGSVGEFVNTIGMGVILALVSSLFLSLTLIPALVGRTRSRKSLMFEPSAKSPWWERGFSSVALTNIYRQILKKILARPMLGIALALIPPLLGFLMVSTLEEQFFPQVDREQFQIELELQSSTSLAQTSTLALQARELILKHPEVTNVHWFVGRNVPPFYYNLISMRQDTANYAQAIVQLKSAKKNRDLINTLQQELNRAFPSAQLLVRQLEQGPYSPAPIELRIFGSDLDTLKEFGDRARFLLSKTEDITHTRSQLTEALPQLKVQVDEEEARLAGLNHTAIAQQLDTNLEGAVGGSILEATEELPVRVRISNSKRSSLEQINSLDLVREGNNSNGDRGRIPLSAISQVKLVPKTATLTRRNGERVNTVQGFVKAGILPSKVLDDFQQRLETDNFVLPPGYYWEFGGEFADRNQAVGNLTGIVTMLLIVMIATLVLTFNSFRLATIIALVGISSVGLSLASLWVFNYPLGFMAILGTVGLVGVAINDSIVMLSALQANPQVRQGDRKAILNVIVHSTRHILTTTITTMAGFIPLLLDGGTFWPPLAICVAGGISGATLLALFFVPCLYLLVNDFKHPRLRSRIVRTKLFNKKGVRLWREKRHQSPNEVI